MLAPKNDAWPNRPLVPYPSSMTHRRRTRTRSWCQELQVHNCLWYANNYSNYSPIGKMECFWTNLQLRGTTLYDLSISIHLIPAISASYPCRVLRHGARDPRGEKCEMAQVPSTLGAMGGWQGGAPQRRSWCKELGEVHGALLSHGGRGSATIVEGIYRNIM